MTHILCLSVLATVGAAKACSEHGAELDTENCGGASWLQERCQLHVVNKTRAGAELDLVHEQALGPYLAVSEFATLAVLGFVMLILIHECWVGRGNLPVLADRLADGYTANSQRACSVYCFLEGAFTNAILIPLSLDYTLAMGESSVASGA